MNLCKNLEINSMSECIILEQSPKIIHLDLVSWMKKNSLIKKLLRRRRERNRKNLNGSVGTKIQRTILKHSIQKRNLAFFNKTTLFTMKSPPLIQWICQQITMQDTFFKPSHKKKQAMANGLSDLIMSKH